jgi:hypothetical protein
MAGRTAKKGSHRKISETFLDFAAPLLETIQVNDSEQQVHNALEVAYTAWNAVIFADVLNNNGYIDQIRGLTADSTGPALLVEHMIARKRALFANDQRLIGAWKVTRTPDGIKVHADARNPHTLPCDPADR